MKEGDGNGHHVINEMGILPQFEGLSCQSRHNSTFHVTIQEEVVRETGQTLIHRIIMRSRFMARERE